MIFFEPTFNPWNLFFEEAPKKSKEQLKLTEDKLQEAKDNFAKELSQITDENTTKLIWDNKDTWTEEMRQAYSNIREGCLAAANKGKKYFTYKSTKNIDFNPVYQYLSSIDGLELVRYRISSSVVKEDDVESVSKKDISVTFKW